MIGLGAAPLAGVLLARLPGAGLALGKLLGLLLVLWLVWLGGSTTLVPYGTLSAALWIALVCAFGVLAWVRGWEGRRAVARGEPRGRLARRRKAGIRFGAGAGGFGEGTAWRDIGQRLVGLGVGARGHEAAERLDAAQARIEAIRLDADGKAAGTRPFAAG